MPNRWPDIDWKHPIVILLVGSSVTLLGWFGREYILPVRGSEARIEAQNARQPTRIERDILSRTNATENAVQDAKLRGDVDAGSMSNSDIAPNPTKLPPRLPDPIVRAATTSRKQAVGLLDATSPKFRGQTVFCDTVRFTLVLDQKGPGSKPVLVHRIALKSETVPEIPVNVCHVDPLSSRPAGIAEKDLYLLSLRPSRTTARYLKSGRQGEAWTVSPDNLLVGEQGATQLTLEANKPAMTFDVVITSHVPGGLKLWLEVDYDAGGERIAATSPLLLAGEYIQ